MADSCCHLGHDALFNEGMARRDLEAYRRNGPGGPTRRLIEALVAEGVEGATLLDIGGGIGAIQHALLEAGAARSVDIDASRAYLAAARAEADRRGFGERVSYRYGDFVALAVEVEPADIVTLDRVICCYADMPALVGRSAERARRLYGLVYPVDRWWTRLVAGLVNAGMAIFRQSFRFQVHATRAVEAMLASRGFERHRHHRGLIWQTSLYRRAATA
jgi:magnesium-protoporphyrin O-methyltransferase